MDDEKSLETSLFWVAYHLVAIDYAREKIEGEIAILDSQRKKRETPEELKRTIAKLRANLTWYRGITDSHIENALSHIPNDIITRARERREPENASNRREYLGKTDGLPQTEMSSFNSALTMKRDQRPPDET